MNRARASLSVERAFSAANNIRDKADLIKKEIINAVNLLDQKLGAGAAQALYEVYIQMASVPDLWEPTHVLTTKGRAIIDTVIHRDVSASLIRNAARYVLDQAGAAVPPLQPETWIKRALTNATYSGLTTDAQTQFKSIIKTFWVAVKREYDEAAAAPALSVNMPRTIAPSKAPAEDLEKALIDAFGTLDPSNWPMGVAQKSMLVEGLREYREAQNLHARYKIEGKETEARREQMVMNRLRSEWEKAFERARLSAENAGYVPAKPATEGHYDVQIYAPQTDALLKEFGETVGTADPKQVAAREAFDFRGKGTYNFAGQEVVPSFPFRGDGAYFGRQLGRGFENLTGFDRYGIANLSSSIEDRALGWLIGLLQRYAATGGDDDATSVVLGGNGDYTYHDIVKTVLPIASAAAQAYSSGMDPVGIAKQIIGAAAGTQKSGGGGGIGEFIQSIIPHVLPAVVDALPDIINLFKGLGTYTIGPQEIRAYPARMAITYPDGRQAIDDEVNYLKRGRSEVAGMGGQFARVQNNEIVDPHTPGFFSRQPPVIRTEGESTVFSHREYLKDVLGGPGFSRVLGMDINPGLSDSFPLLSRFAMYFQKYQFEQLVFYYNSTTTEGNANASGTVILASDLNPESPGFTSKRSAENSQYTTSGKVTDLIVSGFECDPKQIGQTIKYVRYGELISGTDTQNYDMGRFFCYTQNVPQQEVGEIWVEYKVRLIGLRDNSRLPLMPGEGMSAVMFPPLSSSTLPSYAPCTLFLNPDTFQSLSALNGAPPPLTEWHVSPPGWTGSAKNPSLYTHFFEQPANPGYASSHAYGTFTTSPNLKVESGGAWSNTGASSGNITLNDVGVLQLTFEAVPFGTYSFTFTASLHVSAAPFPAAGTNTAVPCYLSVSILSGTIVENIPPGTTLPWQISGTKHNTYMCYAGFTFQAGNKGGPIVFQVDGSVGGGTGINSGGILNSISISFLRTHALASRLPVDGRAIDVAGASASVVDTAPSGSSGSSTVVSVGASAPASYTPVSFAISEGGCYSLNTLAASNGTNTSVQFDLGTLCYPLGYSTEGLTLSQLPVPTGWVEADNGMNGQYSSGLVYMDVAGNNQRIQFSGFFSVTPLVTMTSLSGNTAVLWGNVISSGTVMSLTFPAQQGQVFSFQQNASLNVSGDNTSFTAQSSGADYQTALGFTNTHPGGMGVSPASSSSASYSLNVVKGGGIVVANMTGQTSSTFAPSSYPGYFQLTNAFTLTATSSGTISINISWPRTLYPTPPVVASGTTPLSVQLIQQNFSFQRTQ